MSFIQSVIATIYFCCAIIQTQQLSTTIASSVDRIAICHNRSGLSESIWKFGAHRPPQIKFHVRDAN
jgi:hypothetical protein